MAFRAVQSRFELAHARYGPTWWVGACVLVRVLLIYAVVLGLTYSALRIFPVGFIPNQDKGDLIANVQLPDSSSWIR